MTISLNIFNDRVHAEHDASLSPLTHIADGSQLLPRAALLQQSPGVFHWIGAVVVHCEFGAHEVGSDRKQTGHEMFTPHFESCRLGGK